MPSLCLCKSHTLLFGWEWVAIGNLTEMKRYFLVTRECNIPLLILFFFFFMTSLLYVLADLPSGSFIQEDMSHCSYLCEAGKDCCDQMASCKCGTHTGQFECICEKGYYGKGLQYECTGECLVCVNYISCLAAL